MITLQYALQEEDHLQLQLYLASTSERIRKKRKRHRWSVPLVYLVLALVLWRFTTFYAAVVFVLVAVLWLLFYPKWETRRYRKHYLDFIRENYRKTIGKTITLTLEDDVIGSSNESGSSTLNTSGIMGTDEVGNCYYLRLDKGMVIAIPKDRLGEQAIAFVAWLKRVEQRNNIARNVNLSWQWK